VDESTRRAIAISPASSARERTIDITTIGSRTGRPRRIEVWFYRVEDEIYLSSTPARRAWYGNIVATPGFVFHVKNGARADLAATGTPVLDLRTRERVFRAIIADLEQPSDPAGLGGSVAPLDEWMASSPLVHVRFDEDRS